MNVELILGIDGGGSKTHALVADHTGTVLGSGAAASSNYQVVGLAAATTAVQQAVGEALAQAGLASDAKIAAACLGLAGVDRPADRALWEGWLAETGVARRFALVNDAELVLAGGTPDGWGLALICGTGSICYGRSPDGATARAGGWGHLLGDEGSGYDIALHALRLATQTADGRADAYPILAAILSHWKLSEPTQLIQQVYLSSLTRAEIAQVARLVIELADADDGHARTILKQAGTDLGHLIAAVVHKLELHQPPLALGGGVLGASTFLQQAVRDHAGVSLGPHYYVADPARGALVLAARQLRTGVG